MKRTNLFLPLLFVLSSCVGLQAEWMEVASFAGPSEGTGPFQLGIENVAIGADGTIWFVKDIEDHSVVVQKFNRETGRFERRVRLTEGGHYQRMLIPSADGALFYLSAKCFSAQARALEEQFQLERKAILGTDEQREQWFSDFFIEKVRELVDQGKISQSLADRIFAAIEEGGAHKKVIPGHSHPGMRGLPASQIIHPQPLWDIIEKQKESGNAVLYETYKKTEQAFHSSLNKKVDARSKHRNKEMARLPKTHTRPLFLISNGTVQTIGDYLDKHVKMLAAKSLTELFILGSCARVMRLDEQGQKVCGLECPLEKWDGQNVVRVANVKGRELSEIQVGKRDGQVYLTKDERKQVRIKEQGQKSTPKKKKKRRRKRKKSKKKRRGKKQTVRVVEKTERTLWRLDNGDLVPVAISIPEQFEVVEFVVIDAQNIIVKVRTMKCFSPRSCMPHNYLLWTNGQFSPLGPMAMGGGFTKLFATRDSIFGLKVDRRGGAKLLEWHE